MHKSHEDFRALKAYEDFVVHKTYALTTRTLTREDVTAFAKNWNTPFRQEKGSLIIPRMQLALTMMQGMVSTYLIPAQSLGSPGIEALIWHQDGVIDKPIEISFTVLSKRPSRSKPTLGLVHIRHFVNQTETLLHMENWIMFQKRDPS